MKTRRRVLVWVLALVALAAVCWINSRPGEPRYQGKRLSAWLRESTQCEGGGAVSGMAAGGEPIRRMGTNALPFLVKELGARDPHWLVAIADLLDIQDYVRWRPRMAFQRRQAAYHALAALGTVAEPAIPLISRLLADPDAAVRAASIGTLGRIRSQPQVVVPALLPFVADSNPTTKIKALTALGAFGQDAASAIPALQKAASSPDVVTRSRAKWALTRVQCEMRDSAIVRGPKANRAVALVFTGHEFAEGGETILDELKKHQARASFFFTGDFMVNMNFEPLIRRIIHEHHLLGPHSDKHLLYCSWEKERKTLVTREQFHADLQNNREKIQKTADRLDERPIVPEEGAPLDPRELEAFRWRYGRNVNTNSPAAPEQREQSAGSLKSAEVAEAFWRRYEEQGVTNQPVWRIHSDSEFRYFLPPYEHYNREIADWTVEAGVTLINYTPGTRSNADYTGEADKNFVSSQAIFDSILKKEREDPNGLNGFILLLHIGAGPGRADKFHTRFGELLDVLAAKGYQFVRVDELLEPKETK